MEEVVAKRRNSAGVAYIFVVIVALALIVGGIGIGLGAGEMGAIAIGVAIGGLLLAMGVYYLVRFFMVPNNAIVYKDGLLYLPYKVVCKPEELEKVFIKVYKRYGVVSKYGKMEITVRGKIYKYNDIADAKYSQERLLELNRIAIDRLNSEPNRNTEA